MDAVVLKMTIDFMDFISIILYISLIILVIVLIVLGIKAISTLEKVDKVVDDINDKSSKLNGVFNIIDGATDVVSSFSDSVVNVVSNGVEKIFNRKKEKEDE